MVLYVEEAGSFVRLYVEVGVECFVRRGGR